VSGSRLGAEARWAAKRAADLAKRLVATPFRELPTDLPQRVGRLHTLRDVRMPMRDGVRLCADVYLPETLGPHPTILIRMPYGKREAYCYMPAHGRFWARLGYACVVQDVRGRWASEGVYEPFVHEAADGWDTLDWIAGQPWCSGRIGMTGESYYGYTQWAVAASRHPNLVCAAPGDTAADIYASWAYVNNAFCQHTMGGWTFAINGRRDVNEFRWDPWHLPLATATDAAGHPSVTHKEWIANPRRNGYWSRINVCDRYADVAIPLLHWGGWYDTFLTGTIDGWRGVRAQTRDRQGRDRQRLTIAATDHEMTPEFDGSVGPHRLVGHGYSHDRVARFMDEWLLPGKDGGGAAATASPRAVAPVRYFTMVANEWHTADDWPPPGVEERRFYLRSGGRAAGLEGDGVLSPDQPGDEPPDVYRYDPEDPVTYWLGTSLWEAARYLHDRRPVEGRADVLVFTSEPLARDLEVTGPISATLHVSTSAMDTDFTVALVDVLADGHAHLVQEGIRRLRYRDSDESESKVEPGHVYEITVDLWATSYRFEKGHRLRVEVSSSNFDRYDRNLNTGEDPGLAVRRVVATQTVHHDASRPSFLSILVVPD
jgi:uncharacterized protein